MTRLRRLGLRLEYATIVWNAFEGLTALVAGIAAHSVALTAYGLDSSVEVLASSVAAWQLKSEDKSRDRRALRIIGLCFLGVSIYVGVQAVLHLVRGTHPRSSPVGIALTFSAVIAMVALGIAKLRVGRKLGNPVLVAEAHFSLVDAALSATVLAGLVANAAAGWWWADATVALVLAAFAAKEGISGLVSAANTT
jgi:divalent metal cation (Fe/Co/Zn/Cd) transporter